MKIIMTGPTKTSNLQYRYKNKLVDSYIETTDEYPLEDQHIKNATTLQKTILKCCAVLDKIINVIYYPTKYIARRNWIHIDGYDLWDADVTIAMIVYPILVKLKGIKHGSPHVDNEDVPENLRDGEMEDKLTHEKWDWALNEMIFAFEHLGPKNATWEQEFESGKFGGIIVSDVENSTFKSINIDTGTFKEDKAAKATVRKRIENGLRLFAKYYNGLWD